MMDATHENKYFLMYHNNGSHLFIEKREEIKRFRNGLPQMQGCECLYAAPTLPEMLHQIQNNEAERFLVKLSWIGSSGTRREDRYGHYMSLTDLAGYVPEVCDIRVMDKACTFHDEQWQVEYASELWAMVNDRTIKKVSGFDEAMREAVEQYINEKGLEYATESGEIVTPKPCPCCGGMPKIYQEDGRWFVRCNILNPCPNYPETSPCETAEEAVKEWNNMGEE